MSCTSLGLWQIVDRFEAEVFQITAYGFEEVEELNVLRQTTSINTAEGRSRAEEEVGVRSVKECSTSGPRFRNKEESENLRSILFAKLLVIDRVIPHGCLIPNHW